MLVGTGSDVGKSVLAAGFCRIFKQDGWNPAPFKSQNMSLNSFVTADGGEIGRAQAVQAEACGIECHTDMNPVLLKPGSDQGSQVVVHGKVLGNYSAGSYFRGELKDQLWREALGAFKRLSDAHTPVVMEGAGSISELNLKDKDIVNMSMAMATGAATILVADIERGGVFGSVYGSIELLSPEERACIKGIIINKFRGDVSLFEEGKAIIEKLTGVPVIGIIPSFHHIHIEEEDSVVLEQKARRASAEKINVAVVRLGRISNFTDFDRLERDERVHVFFTDDPEELDKADILVLPGSKNTIADLLELHEKGVADAIIRQAEKQKPVIGICGGYQMMGETIEDPEHVEGAVEKVNGLGLLPVKTLIGPEKSTVRGSFFFKNREETCTGYEIHKGQTFFTDVSTDAVPLNRTADGRAEGCMDGEHIWGSYFHGILDNPVVISDLLRPFVESETDTTDYAAWKQKQYDLLADHMRENLDMDRIYKILIE
ncbi:MAG: cobyric acid synthase [Marinilabiliaceae bacterium]